MSTVASLKSFWTRLMCRALKNHVLPSLVLKLSNRVRRGAAVRQLVSSHSHACFHGAEADPRVVQPREEQHGQVSEMLGQECSALWPKLMVCEQQHWLWKLLRAGDQQVGWLSLREHEHHLPL